MKNFSRAEVHCNTLKMRYVTIKVAFGGKTNNSNNIWCFRATACDILNEFKN